MGASQDKLPNTFKVKKDLDSKIFKIGIAEMQGWRGNMEDANVIYIANKVSLNNEENLDVSTNSANIHKEDSDYLKILNKRKSIFTKDRETKKILINSSPQETVSIIGVFDGHGGSFVSKFISDNFLEVFYNCWVKVNFSNFKSNDENKKINHEIQIEELGLVTMNKFEQILIETFLEFDELLKTKVVGLLVEDYRNFRREDLKLKNITDVLNNLEYDNNSEVFATYMGSTANVVCLYENYLIIANVGDSISVIFSEGRAIELNTEHKTSTPGEYERIINAGLNVINNRVDGKLNLTRAIGDLKFKDSKLKSHEQAVTAYPEITTYELNNDCEFVVTACDGVWDCVEPQKLCEFISKSIKEDKILSDIISTIEDMILSKTNNSPIGTDNMTCIIMQFK